MQGNKSLWHMQSLPPARGEGETTRTCETPHGGINCLPPFRSSDLMNMSGKEIMFSFLAELRPSSCDSTCQ